ncbi:hypothetical protein TPHA_0H02240 [Tetrapisispora phaffii CBS 4417]|uniref:Uncharacterized protein n=1 Tax=Tetrapisispora phaffii (strain ATCC 24235 / CBS 4417 / NBRC 1672 / NRRL Y-8282 / UCD 70-5) TaxID=1071381 RepID=G8BWH7_TETPH|nr:hypothetical protein TPHA_0H02240 [Tetrapisispora phaffii CBS 4417]CCE64428.1 hypothetical protein TPHA_0H02240 [Tetrapisispora phaffii CBS 4417]
MSVIFEAMNSFSRILESMNAEYLSYTPEQLKEMSVFQRLSVYNFTFEFFCISIIVLIFVFYQVGISINKGKADKLFKEFNNYFGHDLKFSRVAFSDKDNKELPYAEQEKSSWFTSFATGRSSIESITLRAHLYPRNNPISLGFELVLGYFFPSLKIKDLEEFAEFTIKPNGIFVSTETSEANGNAKEILKNFKFVTAIVNKSAMNESRRDNFFLSVTHTSESDKLPANYVYMSEVNQFNGIYENYVPTILNKDLLLKLSHILKFVSFTDLPSEKPFSQAEWEANQQPKAVIRVSFPTSTTDIENIKVLIGAVVEIFDKATNNLVNNKGTQFIKPDMLNKSLKLRSQHLDSINKAIEQAKKELAAEKKYEADKEMRRQKKKSGELLEYDKKMAEKRARRAKNKQKQRMQ